MTVIDSVLPTIKLCLDNDDLKTRFLSAKLLVNSSSEIHEFIPKVNHIFLEGLKKDNSLSKIDADFALIFLGNHGSLQDIIAMHNLLANPNFMFHSICYICINANKNFESLRSHFWDLKNTIDSSYKLTTSKLLGIPENQLITKSLKTGPEKIKYSPEAIIQAGHILYQLNAQDTTARHADYFVLVEPLKEKEFISVLDGDSNINLEDYGTVIASCYGEEPNDEVKHYLMDTYGLSVQ